jgi:ComF family protein
LPRFNDFRLYVYIEEYAEAKIPEKIVGALKSRRADLHGLFLADALQILTPYKKGPAGTHELNVLLQSTVNGAADAQKSVKTFEYTFHEGDKVMQTKNDYQMKWQNVTTYEKGQGIFNGEMGEIKYINPAQNSFSVLFGGEKFATYANSDAEALILAYAVTIHKSQGCEFDSVIIPLYNRNPRFLTRNLIYTAVTRAKNSVVIIGERRVLQMMIKNNDVPRRMSALTERICDEVNRHVLDSVFGRFLFVDNPVCPSCKRVMFFDDGAVCRRCRDKLHRAPQTVCAKCGAPSGASTFCRSCLSGYALDAGICLYHYDGVSSAIIKDFKYAKNKGGAYLCGQYLADELKTADWMRTVDMVAYVPGSPEKEKARGYNQAYMIACGIAEKSALMVGNGILIKTAETKDQIGLRFEERFENVKGAFAVADPQAVCGRNILIADDVFTSGATLNECAHALRLAGASRIYFATVAYADQY